MELVLLVHILDRAVCVSLHANAHRKGMNLFSFQLWVNSRAIRVPRFLPWEGNQSRKRKTEFKSAVIHLEIDIVSHLAHGGRAG